MLSEISFTSEEGQTFYIKNIKKGKESINSLNQNNLIHDQPQRYKVTLKSELLFELSKIFPSEFTSKRGLQILSVIIHFLESQGKKELTEREVELLASDLVQKGIDLSLLKSIIKKVIYSAEIVQIK